VTGSFHTTRWSLVARAGAADPAAAQRALGELCEQYWPPLYAYARKRGLADDAARDAVQSFCLQLLERGGVDGARPEAGRFRAYLLGAFANALRNDARAAHAQKRGGGRLPFPLDDADAAFDAVAAAKDGPEQAFARRWAHALLERAKARLRAEHVDKGKAAVHDALAPALLGADDADFTRRTAERLGATDGAVRVALHRLRRRFGELVRDEVAATVRDAADVDAELAELQHALALGPLDDG
jgi:RNA polymerase sigma-70 factor (ECF subfamily)